MHHLLVIVAKRTTTTVWGAITRFLYLGSSLCRVVTGRYRDKVTVGLREASDFGSLEHAARPVVATRPSLCTATRDVKFLVAIVVPAAILLISTIQALMRLCLLGETCVHGFSGAGRA